MKQPEEIFQLREDVIEYLTKSLPPQQVKEVRSLLAKYFLEKGEEEFEKMAAEKQWNNETYKQWLNEHHRTSYK